MIKNKNPLEEHHVPDPIDDVIEGLHGSLGIDDEIKNRRLYIPKFDVTVKPFIEQQEENLSVLGFHVTCPEFDAPLYECCAAGTLGTAGGMFLMSFWDGILKMMNDNSPERIETEFAGRIHHWSVYKSASVGFGAKIPENNGEIYWEMLKDGIMKRLGNQRLVYVKVYAARYPEQTVGEVRVNDIKSEELSQIAAKYAESWDTDVFTSHKLFFFIKQSPDTILPDQYSGFAGRTFLKEKVKIAAGIFHNISDSDYPLLGERLCEALGDKTLAEECRMFLPEICAERAFSQISFPETVDISIGQNERQTYYKAQLADYYPIASALFSLFDENYFADETNAVYREYISVSAIFSLVKKYQENGRPVEGCRLSPMLFSFGDDFQLR